MYEDDPEVKRLIDTAKRLEGLPRHTGMHAAGVVISQKPMDEYVPLSRGGDGTITTQFVMTTIEELGLLKMDFLGLRTLTVIDDAVQLVKKNYGVSLDMDHIDYDDKKVLDLISSGKTEGIFQLESAGMKNFMKELRPESLEDVIAGISLYRPGPMDFIPAYIKGKNDKASITYDCPQLEPILAPTYGCIVYQEQVMQIVRDLGGLFYGSERSGAPCHVQEKDPGHGKERQNFVYGNEEEGVKGCIANRISEAVANKIYDDMIDFAKYAFNKSHAAAYAVVAYQTAFLKYYYPVEFMAALMTSVLDNAGKVAEYIMVCREMGIDVLPPDINVGEGQVCRIGRKDPLWHVCDQEYWTSGRGFHCGRASAERRLQDYRGFLKACQWQGSQQACGGKTSSRRGAMDGLDGNRHQMIAVFPSIMDRISSDKKSSMAGQMTLFDIASDDIKEEVEIKMRIWKNTIRKNFWHWKKEVLGVYISGHPLEKYTELLKKNVTAGCRDFMLDEETHKATVADRAMVIIGGMITDKTIKYTRNNQTMAFITIEDLLGSVEVIVFAREYEKYRNLLKWTTRS